MARVTVEGDGRGGANGDGIAVRLSPREMLLARRRELRVPRAAVKAAGVEPDWWRAVRGGAKTGRCSPGRYCVGERRHPCGRDFVAVRAGLPVLVLDLWRPDPYTRLAVSTADAASLAATLRAWLAHSGPPPRGSAVGAG